MRAAHDVTALLDGTPRGLLGGALSRLGPLSVPGLRPIATKNPSLARAS
jgi:hypothetical protein